MLALRELYAKIRRRQFEPADARELIKTSYYFAGAHPDVHIDLSVSRPADFHFQEVPKYEQRGMHSMFQSMDDAAMAISAALNCATGEEALRLLPHKKSVAIHSRTAAQHIPEMTVRSAIASMGVRTGTMYGTASTAFVVVVLNLCDGSVVLTTAYPTHMIQPKQWPAMQPPPPDGKDLLEYGGNFYPYP